MKRIEFIAPVEAIRGNMSGAQKLVYAENDNPAYASPMGQRNYARNYRPSFIGAKRAKDGLKYFTVRTKSAVRMTAKSKKAMALLGGTGAIFASILRSKSSQLYANLYAQWLELQNLGSKKTFKQSVCDAIRAGLIAKQAEIPYSGPRGVVNITNPWNYTGETPNVTVGTDILVKFWTELATNGINYTVDGLMGIARSGDIFGSTYFSSNLNILGLDEATVQGAGPCVVIKTWTGGQIPDELQVLTFNGTPIAHDTAIVAQAYTIAVMPHEV